MISFRPGGKAGLKSSSEPATHASSLISKNYAFTVGPVLGNGARQLVTANTEASEKINPDRSSGGANNASPVSASIAPVASQQDQKSGGAVPLTAGTNNSSSTEP